MKEEALMLLQVLVHVLVVVLEGRQQAGDVADAFSDALPEEQLGAQPQILRVFDEAESNHSSLASTQLVLQQVERERYFIPPRRNMTVFQPQHITTNNSHPTHRSNTIWETKVCHGLL